MKKAIALLMTAVMAFATPVSVLAEEWDEVIVSEESVIEQSEETNSLALDETQAEDREEFVEDLPENMNESIETEANIIETQDDGSFEVNTMPSEQSDEDSDIYIIEIEEIASNISEAKEEEKEISELSSLSAVQPTKLTSINGVYYYEISKAEELQYIAEEGGDWLNYNYILKNDIVINDTQLSTDNSGNLTVDTSELIEWEPITWFTGIFDGNGYSVSGVYSNKTNTSGFFGLCRGEIKNLHITNSYIKGSSYVGGVCAQLQGGDMTNCSFEGTVVGVNNTGGLAGECSANIIIDNCTNYGDVYSSGSWYVGGIVGYYRGLKITNCTNYGNIISSTADYVAGIVGFDETYPIQYCQNYGKISGNNYVAGICGHLEGAPLTECVNKGDINGNMYVGGLCGYAEWNNLKHSSSISKCYNTGKISGTSCVGGITGYLYYENIENSYNVGNVSGEENVGAIVGESQSIWGQGEVNNCYYLIGDNWGFGNISEDIEGSIEGKDDSFFPILNDPNSDGSFDNLGYRISKCTVSLSVSNYTYDGSEKKPSVTVKYGSITLKNGTDYTVSYSNNINAGTATVTVIGKGEYNGTLAKNFTINKANQTLAAKAAISSIEVGKTTTITASGKGTITYSSSNTSVATVNSSGVVTGKAVGTATITVKAAGNSNYNSASTTVKITVTASNSGGTSTALKKGSSYTSGDFVYKILTLPSSGTGTVRVTGPAKSSIKTAAIPAKVAIGGRTFKVTEIGAKAFKGCKKLTTVSTGKNVTVIGNQAFQGCTNMTGVSIQVSTTTIGKKVFYNCQKLKKIVIKSKQLTSVGKNTFKGIKSNATIKVPKSRLKAYTKLLKGKGQGSKVKITS